VDWHIMQVERVLATDLGLVVPLIKPTYSVGHDDPRKRVCSIVHEPSIRAYLLARLPHSLLFGRRGELTTTAPQPHPHYRFGNHHHRSGTAEQQRPPTPSGLDVTTHQLREEDNNYNNDKLEELVRALGLPLHRGGSGARSPLFSQWMNFTDAPPTLKPI
jgi:hypothetical protein